MQIPRVGNRPNQIRPMPNLGQNATIANKDPLLQRTLLPPSERGSYTEGNALINKYMDQFRIEGKIEGNTFILKDGSNVGLVMADQVTPEELEAFRQKLIQDGVSSDIDWQGVTNDFVQMGVGFDNAESLTTKIDYITSRYAILKDRIEKDYTGDEQKAQLEKLNSIFDTAKKTIADTYSQSVGEFYEDLGNEGISEQMRDSILSGIDDRIAEYQGFLQENGDSLSAKEDSDKWLLNDDAYMAALLRDKMSAGEGVKAQSAGGTQAEAGGAEYSLHDLGVAGVFAKACTQQMNSLNGSTWPDDEQSIGLDLAFQAMQADYLAEHTNISDKMSSLIKDSFDSYMEDYIEKLDDVMESIADKSKVPGTKRELNKDTIYSVYQYTMEQYKESGDIMDAISKGAFKAKESYNKDYTKGNGLYADKNKWDNFFEVAQYGKSQPEVTEFDKYRSLTEQFVNSLKNGSEKNIKMFFAQAGKASTGQYSDSTMNLYA